MSVEIFKCQRGSNFEYDVKSYSPVVCQSYHFLHKIVEVLCFGVDEVLNSNMAQKHLAFRQLIYNFSQKLSKEECQAIVYIRLYECREQYRDVSTLDVLSKLEMCGIFSPSDPAGLIHVAKDIHRCDLVNLVKDYTKSQRLKEKKAKTKNANTVEDTSLHSESSDEEMTQLRATLEVTLSQASVLAQQVDILQRAIVLKERQTAAEANKEAGRAVKELAEHLRKVQEALERRTSPRSSTSYSSEEGELRFRNIREMYHL